MSEKTEERIGKMLHPGEKIFYVPEAKKTALFFPFMFAACGALIAFLPQYVISAAAAIDASFAAFVSTFVSNDAGKALGIIVMVLSAAAAGKSDTRRHNNLCFITNMRLVKVRGIFDPEIREFYLNRIGFIKLKRTMWERFLAVGTVEVYDNAWTLNKKSDVEEHHIIFREIPYPDYFRNRLKEAVERYKDYAQEHEKENPSMERFHIRSDTGGGHKRRQRQTQARRGAGKRK